VQLKKNHVRSLANRERQELLNKKLSLIMIKNPMTLQRVAIEIGISYPTLRSFINKSRYSTQCALDLIERYIMAHL
jgi:hypothetical protein